MTEKIIIRWSKQFRTVSIDIEDTIEVTGAAKITVHISEAPKEKSKDQ